MTNMPNSNVNFESENPWSTLSHSQPKTKPKHNLSIKSININGIRGKKLELQMYLEINKPDIVAFQETKIDASITNSELFHDNLDYDVFRSDRSLKGGGVMLLIKRALNASPVSVSNVAESVWAKVNLGGSVHYFASWYRPPDSHSDHILSLSDQMIQMRSNHKTNNAISLHVLGDFNFR